MVLTRKEGAALEMFYILIMVITPVWPYINKFTELYTLLYVLTHGKKIKRHPPLFFSCVSVFFHCVSVFVVIVTVVFEIQLT